MKGKSKKKNNFTGRIKSNTKALEKEEHISFSFKHINFSDSEFHFPTCNKYHKDLFDRLQKISDWTKSKILNKGGRTMRCHPIDFTEKNVSRNGFPCNLHLDYTPYQFSLGTNKAGRLHGYWVESTFYIVWFDPDHILYPGQK